LAPPPKSSPDCAVGSHNSPSPTHDFGTLDGRRHRHAGTTAAGGPVRQDLNGSGCTLASCRPISTTPASNVACAMPRASAGANDFSPPRREQPSREGRPYSRTA
jgi:hypothetical protein